MAEAKRLQAPFELVVAVAETGKLPVPNFAAGGIATPADAALCMPLGAEAVFVGSGIFKSDDPENRARAIVKATTHWRDAAGAGRGGGVAGLRHEGDRGGEPARGVPAPDAGMVTGRHMRGRTRESGGGSTDSRPGPGRHLHGRPGPSGGLRGALETAGGAWVWRASRRGGPERSRTPRVSSCPAANPRPSGSSSRRRPGRRRFGGLRPTDARSSRPARERSCSRGRCPIRPGRASA